MSTERAATTPHKINNERRQIIFGTIAGATMLAVAGALSQVEQAHAAVETAVNFRNRGKSVNRTSSPSLDIPQKQPVNIQDTPTPDATVTAANKEKAVEDAIAARNANDWWRTNLVPLPV